MRLRELTWVRLLTLLLWTVLMMISRGITQIIGRIEGQIFDTSEPTLRENGRKRELRGTLLSPLDDELVLRRIWPLLHKKVNVSLLWRLRRVNRAWKNEVGKTIEWAALEMVRLDSPGYLLFLAERGERRPSMQERVEVELNALMVLLSECLESVVVRSRELQSGTVIQGSAEGDRRRHWKDCMCRRGWAPYQEMSSDIREIEFSRSEDEEEESEAYASSTDSSLSVCYPRHVLRIK